MEYVIRGGLQGRERLRLLSDVMGHSTRALLKRVGIPAGSVCLDVGCGGGDVTRELARLAGPTGRVMGVDIDEVKIDIARCETEQHGFSNIEFEVRDVMTWEPDGTFDVVYARFILSHLPNPGEVIDAMHQHLRPGGVMIVEDIDFRGHFAEPDCPALDQYVELYANSVAARGADANIGPRLAGLLRDSGILDVGINLEHPVALEAGIKLLSVVTLENIAETVINDGLVSEQEFAATLKELDAFTQDPQTVIGGPRIFQVWGRRPK